jgi:hypothetical protein
MTELITSILKGIVSVFIYVWWIPVIVLGYFAWQNTRKSKWIADQESTVLEIKVPKNNEKNPTAAEMMFATLHGILKPKSDHIKEGTVQEHISFEIVADEKAIRFYVWTPKNLKDFVEGQIYAQYPAADISECEDYADKLQQESFVTGRTFAPAEIVLEKEDFLPIKTFNNFQVDPLAAITGVLSKLDGKNEEIWVQILSRPVGEEWKKRGLDWVKAKKSGSKISSGLDFGALLRQPIEILKDFIYITVVGPLEAKDGGKDGPKLSSEEDSRIAGTEEKSQKLAYETKIRVLYSSLDDFKAKDRTQAVIGAFKQFNTTNLNGFKGKSAGAVGAFLDDYRNRIFLDEGYHLNIEELASIYHLPHLSVETPNINWTAFKTAEPPTTLPTIENTEPNDIALFAETNFRGKTTTFGIKRDDRRRHMYLIGKTGMGKTKLMESLILNDIKNGEGVGFIDPHGESFDFILERIPKERMKDVVIFDPSDVNFPVAFNPMEVVDEALKIQIAAGIVGTFKKIFGFSWGPRLEYILNYTILALLDTPGSNLVGVVRMLTDKGYRKKIVDNVKDPVVKKFWVSEFASYNDKFASEAIAPILNKVGQFIANSMIRNVIGQPKSSFNIRQLMDDQKIFLVNLSVGKVGETNASLLGSFMITAIHLAAMSRADINERDRKDFYFYVDEFQNFATESFKNILSEARKYRLNLIVANQYTAQIEESGVKDAVFGNIGTMITFRVGAADANELIKEFEPTFESQDLMNLPRQNIYLKMIIDGQAEAPFSAKALTLDLSPVPGNLKDDIIAYTREHYSNPRAEVERAVEEYTGMNITYANVEKEIETGERESATAPRKGSREALDLSAVIKANTSHLKDSKEQPKPETVEPARKEPAIPEELPQKSGIVKDRIDKETLSAILEQVIKPADKAQAQKEPQVETKRNKEDAPTKNVIKVKGESRIPETEVKVKENKIINTPSEKHNRQPARDGIKVINTITQPMELPADKKVSFPSHRSETIITPENFKKIKQIHPHETVRIVSEPKEIEEGKQIKF